MISSLPSFLPELVLLAGALVLFGFTLGEGAAAGRRARGAALGVALAFLLASVASLHQHAELFAGAYRVDAFSQWLKVVIAAGYTLVVLLSGSLADIRGETKPEYHLFLALSMTGLTMLVGSVEIITIVVALELSSFPLYLMVPMRREREGQRTQMESAIKYIMFGVAANGIAFFGLSYLFGLTGTTHLAPMLAKLAPVVHTPLAIVGLGMAFAGLYYKLAVFPFHFWTPDVYQGASNETAALIASLPKVGAVAVLVRFVSLATPDNATIATLLTWLAIASMCYGNLIALVQKDLKRLLGFSGIAHAGYALVGFVALSPEGYAASLFYITGYALMVLACFVVISRVSRDGANLSIEELAGLHRRSPLLAVTLLVSVFALGSMPLFVGFMGKLGVLTAALAKGHLALVIVTMVNSAIAIYYYLQIVRQGIFGENEKADTTPIALDGATRVLCVLLIVGIVALGLVPAPVLNAISQLLVCL
jgi:NADH-quinone oxidoreductase subunit N